MHPFISTKVAFYFMIIVTVFASSESTDFLILVKALQTGSHL
jgi:hypothetical protein